ncbi:MAG TPA: hypothetical protein VFW19_07305 [Allosphingosinicella sp.]|nr:hypothetical protein [Allosphingosinicella sp.]
MSILYRRRAGKPIHPHLPPNAAFAERGASGPWASRCLLVAVTDEAFMVTPFFPFNLMFLPEIYGLEVTIPLHAIRSVTISDRWLGSNIVIDRGEGRRKVRVRVSRPHALAAALEKRGVDTRRAP